MNGRKLIKLLSDDESVLMMMMMTMMLANYSSFVAVAIAAALGLLLLIGWSHFSFDEDTNHNYDDRHRRQLLPQRPTFNNTSFKPSSDHRRQSNLIQSINISDAHVSCTPDEQQYSTAIQINNDRAAQKAQHQDSNASISASSHHHHQYDITRDQGLYRDWQAFQQDFESMLKQFRVFIYPEAYNLQAAHHDLQYDRFAKAFLPHSNPYDLSLGNYFSEHIFKIVLLQSSFVTLDPSEAHFFFLPFSVNVLRNDPRVKTEDRIARFVAEYVHNVSMRYTYWNRTQGADHFYVCCHSVGAAAASMSPSLQKNAVQVVCSSNYYLRTYSAHKDVAMPQVWPRSSLNLTTIPPPHYRSRLAFFAGRAQNSRVRERLVKLWGNDSDMDIHGGNVRGSYEEAFQRSKFCLHVKGYEVNTARIADAIHFGCVPVIISDHYDLPFANVLNWKKIAVIIGHADIASLKQILLSVTHKQYAELHENVCKVREHFQWQAQPSGYDAFLMTMYQLWLRRGVARPFPI